MSTLIEPHGGTLKQLWVPEEEADELKRQSRDLPSWDLTPRQLCDTELLLVGGFSPLDGFMTQENYRPVLDDLRLSDHTLWPIPITLDVSESFAEGISKGSQIALRDPEGVLIAVLIVQDVWKPDLKKEAQQIYNTDDSRHPGFSYLMDASHPVYLGGTLKGLTAPSHYDFRKLRDTPEELRGRFLKMGWHRIAAFHTHTAMHRAQYEMTQRAVKGAEANLLIHPIVGITKPGDVDHYTRVRSYERLMKRYPAQTTALSLVPIATRMAGPREAVWHALIRQNYGCTHMILSKNHASPAIDGSAELLYRPYEGQELINKYKSEMRIQMIRFNEMVYVEEEAEYLQEDQANLGDTVCRISGPEFMRRLEDGVEIPSWFSFPEVVEEFRKTYPARHLQGFTVFFTGLSGAGKSTIANALMVKLLEMGGRSVTLLDGDIVRKNLSSELGFSREHRDLNILRIGYVASEITKHRGIAICAPIAPYRSTREKVCNKISAVGGMVEVYVSTPIEVCEARDRKGLYAKARAGIIKQFTGISDPYEAPENPELAIDTTDSSPDEAVERIILKLESLGYIK